MNLRPGLPIALALGLLSVLAFGQHHATGTATVEPGWTTDFAKATALAKKTGKIVMVDFNATWCGPCQMYKHDVFPTHAFKNATQGVILVDIDTDKQPGLAQKFGVSGIPDIRLFSPSGKQVGSMVGFGGADRLIKEIEKAKKASKK